MAIRPIIIVQTNPQSAISGQLLAVSARLFDENTMQPVEVSRIFMEIVSEKDGTIVWPLEVVRKNASGFDILIGTSEMKQGHSYIIRVSNNWNLSPIGFTTIMIKKEKTSPIPYFPIFGLPFSMKIPIDDLIKHDIESFVFRTQMDHRVCPKCKEYENRVFETNQWKPDIPIHYNCRCTYDVIFKIRTEKGLTASLKMVAEVIRVTRVSKEILPAIEVINELEKIKS